MLTLQNVQKSSGSFTAINGIDLDIREGSIFGLLDPNGAGKTTLLRMVMGLIPPTSGTITLLFHWISRVLPLTHANILMRNVLLKNLSFWHSWLQVLTLFTFFTIVLVLLLLAARQQQRSG
jgi:ABC-type multidrug transport system ATPase subunit